MGKKYDFEDDGYNPLGDMVRELKQAEFEKQQEEERAKNPKRGNESRKKKRSKRAEKDEEGSETPGKSGVLLVKLDENAYDKLKVASLVKGVKATPLAEELLTKAINKLWAECRDDAKAIMDKIY